MSEVVTAPAPAASAARARAGDRRRRPTPMLSRYWLFGRRRGGRRAGEIADVYVDRYARAEWTWWLLLTAAVVVDWAWTLAHLDRGVAEGNPALAAALAAGGRPAFTALKLGVSALALPVLLLHARFRLVRRLLPVAAAVYAAVLVVHACTEASL